MASLSNINGLFDVHSTGAILFSTSHGTSGQILQSSGNAAPIWVNASTIVGDYLPLAGGTLTGATATATGISFTVGGNLIVNGASATVNALSATTGSFTGTVTANQFISTNNGNGTNYRIGDDVWIGDINVANTFRVQGVQDSSQGYITFGSNNTQLGRSGTGALTWGGDASFTGIITATGGNSTEWNTAYDNSITALAVSGTTTKTLTATQQDGGTLTASWTDNNTGGTVTSVAVTAGTGITASVANSTTTPNITITNSAPNIVQTSVTGASGYLDSNRGIPSSAGQYWQASGLGTTEAPSTDWYNTWRGSHGSPLTYYSNTLAIKMTGSGPGTIYTQTISNGTALGWNKYWHDGNFSPGSYLPLTGGTMANTNVVVNMNADLLDGQQGSYYFQTNITGNAYSASSLEQHGNNSNPNNLNTLPWGKTSNYASGGYWSNGPSGMSYGSVYNFGGYSGNSALALEIAGDITHNSTSSTKDLWFRMGNNLGFQNDWKKIWNSENLPNPVQSSGVTSVSGTGTVSGLTLTGTVTSTGNITLGGAISGFLPLAGGIMSGNIGRSAYNSGYQVGGYNNIGASHAQSNPIHVIGTDYTPGTTTLGNMYGIGYTRADASFMGVATGSGWGMYVAADGNARVWLDGSNGNISAAGVIYASGGNSNTWNTHTSNTGTVTSVATGNGLTGGTITSTGTLTMSGSYSGTFSPTALSTTSTIRCDGGHGDTRLYLQYNSTGGLGALTGWVSEPGISYTSSGIGGNIYVGGQYYGRATNSGYGTYVRFNTNGQIEHWQTTGNSGVSGGQGSIAWYNDAAGNSYSTTSSRAPIFYDTNTAYYVDPAGGSNLNGNMLITSGKLKVSTGSLTYGTGYNFHNIENTLSNEPICVFYNSVPTTAVQFYGLNVQSAAHHNNTTSRFFLGQGSSTEKIKIYSNGNIQNSNNSYGQLSDINLKENVVDATPKLDELNQVRIVNFNYIGDIDKETNTPNKQIGVIAQELEEIFPGMVYECGDTEVPTKAVKYSVLVPILVKAIQEQQVIIDDLKSRIEKLEL